MAFGATPAGTIVRETIISTRRVPVKAATTITKGQVCELNGGYLIPCAAAAATADVAHFVALETANNAAGANAAITAAVAVAGHYVTVVANGAIQPGGRVQVDGAIAGRVKAAAGTISTQCGTYFGKEGGIVAKGGAANYLESYTDNQDFPPVAAAAGDVIEVLLI